MGYIGDLGSYVNAAAGNGSANGVKAVKKSSNNIGLDMTDFLKLMIAQFQNQSIDDTADTSEMLNQMVQMQMIQALVNMTDASLMSYAASLVGKEVTIGLYDEKGKLHEVVGTVTATGSYDGEQVVFVDDTYYYMSQILSVGRLPKKEEENKPEGTPGVDGNNPPQPEESQAV